MFTLDSRKLAPPGCPRGRGVSKWYTSNGVFTVPDTDAYTDKMGLQPNCICVGVCVCAGQYEHFHTILYNIFLSVSVSHCLGVGQYEHSTSTTYDLKAKDNYFSCIVNRRLLIRT